MLPVIKSVCLSCVVSWRQPTESNLHILALNSEELGPCVIHMWRIRYVSEKTTQNGG